jgi:single-strand DNA-binding protein
MNESTATLIGNATRDPELQFTTGGKATVKIGIAVSRRYQVNNEWQEETSFYTVVAWESLAENIAASVVKGTRIIATGRLSVRKWQPQDGGPERTSIELIADEVGVALRWASAEVARNQRTQTDTTATGRPRKPKAPDPVYSDEEPF